MPIAVFSPVANFGDHHLYQFLVRPKQFGPALIILGPVIGQGISLQDMLYNINFIR